jgi:hypothetical protein
MALTQVIVIVEKDKDGVTVNTYCNDPEAHIEELREDTVVECGCCGHYHRRNYHGDCRNDDHRFVRLE